MPDDTLPDVLAAAKRGYRKAIEEARIARISPYASPTEAAEAADAVLTAHAAYQKLRLASRVAKQAV